VEQTDIELGEDFFFELFVFSYSGFDIFEGE
jgi:hypothetical protein